MSRASSPPSPTNSIDDGRPSLSELAPARRAAWLAKLSSTPEYKILSKLSQPSTSVHDVFHEIQELVFAAVSNRGESSNDFSLDLSNVYESLIEIIHVTSRAEQSPFVEFLFLLKTELGDRGDSDVEFDEVEKAWFKEDGPVFGMLVRESHGLNSMCVSIYSSTIFCTSVSRMRGHSLISLSQHRQWLGSKTKPRRKARDRKHPRILRPANQSRRLPLPPLCKMGL